MTRRLRTFAALLFHVLLLQVSVLGGGMACASAWSGAAVATRAAVAAPVDAAHDAHAEHGAHAAHAVPATPAADDAPVDASGGSAPHHGDVTHCATAAGCAAVAVVGPAVTPAALAAVHARAESVPGALPPSTRAAPEPPPPRA